MLKKSSEMLFRIPLLICGVFCCSTAVLMIKASQVDPILLAALRLLVATAALGPVFWRDHRQYRDRWDMGRLKRTALPGIILGLHFISWNFAARMTLAANASLIVNMLPAVMPFLLYLLIRERPNRREILGTIIALSGVVILVGADFHLARGYFTGDLLSFGSMLLFGLYLALGRRNSDFPTIWLYVVPLYLTAGITSLVIWLVLYLAGPEGLATVGDISQPIRELGFVLGLGLIPTVTGHSIMNYSMKHIRGQAVSIANLGQFIFAGLMAWAILSEIPAWNFYIACGLVVSGAVTALRGHQPKPDEIPPIMDD